MPSKNEKIDRHLRRNSMRRALVIVIITTLFIGFMSYALYREYGPGAEIVDYFPEVNRGEQGIRRITAITHVYQGRKLEPGYA